MLLLQRIAIQCNETGSAHEAVRLALDAVMEDQAWTVAHAYFLRLTGPTGPAYYPSPRLWRCREPVRLRHFRRETLESRFRAGEGTIGTVGRESRPRWIEDTRSSRLRQTARPLGVRSGVLVPVATHDDEPAGAVLEFYSERRRRGAASRLRALTGLSVILGSVFERERAERRLAESRETEQRRLGRELHDSVSQELTAIALSAERLTEELKRSGAASVGRAEKLAAAISDTRARVHALSRGLLPMTLEVGDLVRAVEYMVESTRAIHGVDCLLQVEGSVEVREPELLNHLVRIVQEAIQNAVKHADPSRIAIELRHADNTLTLTVTDDGVGFRPGRRATGVGLRTMQHRASAIGAELAVTSQPGKGTRVRCSYRA